MRRVRQGFAAVLSVTATCLLAAACGAGGGSPGSGGSAGSGPAASGGSITVGWAEEPDTLNPATSGARDTGPIDANIFDTLVYLTQDNQPTPDLATKWSVSSNGKVYSFTLRSGVKF
ncbi:MAG: peptide/nickel transport system substrate-binding protein, partial [Trebonia sp.]|nr:peptide/nickel transport system substrate-binding protein [Trebonia sp.]